MTNILIILVAFIVALFFAFPAFAKNLVVCSEFRGQLVERGNRPVAGKTVIRRWNNVWTNKTGEQITTTDEQGYFIFPEQRVGSLTALIIPHEPSTFQHILSVDDKGTEKEFWYARKSSYAKNSELIDLRDDYTNENAVKDAKLDFVCHLDKEPMSEERFVYASSCALRD